MPVGHRADSFRLRPSNSLNLPELSRDVLFLAPRCASDVNSPGRERKSGQSPIFVVCLLRLLPRSSASRLLRRVGLAGRAADRAGRGRAGRGASPSGRGSYRCPRPAGVRAAAERGDRRLILRRRQGLCQSLPPATSRHSSISSQAGGRHAAVAGGRRPSYRHARRTSRAGPGSARRTPWPCRRARGVQGAREEAVCQRCPPRPWRRSMNCVYRQCAGPRASASVRPPRRDDQVDVIGHQAVGVDREAEPLRLPGEQLQIDADDRHRRRTSSRLLPRCVT